jgi:kumamolisin
MIVRSLPFLTALALGVASGAGAAAAVPASHIDASVRDLGPAPSSVKVRVAVVLNYRHEAELEQLVESQADPDSKLFGHFLSPGLFRDYFAPTPADYARVIAALRAGGFTIANTFGNRTVVDAVAPAPVAGHFFGVDIHRVLSPDAGLTYAASGHTVIPAQLGGAVYAVVGLDASHRMHPNYVFPKTQEAAARPLQSPSGNPIFGPYGGYGPLVYINAYDLPAANGYTGTGRTSGVATDNDFLDSDLASFLSYFGETRTGPPTQRVYVDGGPSQGLGPDSVETTLDVETVVSISPGTALYVYEAPYDEPSNSNFIDIFNQVVTDDLVDTLNSSYTYCETAINDYVPGYTKALNKVELQGSAEGITFHAAAGDSGAYAYGCGSAVSVGEPTSTPNNISVGGTTLSVNNQGQETGEVGWSGGTGGGVSVIFKVPHYQKNVPNIIKTGRNLPDVAFDADPGTGTALYYDGGWGTVGGTSLASPIFGGTMAQINQLRKSRSGLFNVTLYKTWLKHGYGSGSTPYFRDITQGSIPPFSAGPGYDQMSGIGALQATNFAGLIHAHH